jgi:hypothetical protein
MIIDSATPIPLMAARFEIEFGNLVNPVNLVNLV